MKRSMRPAVAALCMLIAIMACNASAAPASTRSGAVWIWSSQCSDPKTITVAVSVAGKIVYQSSTAICRVQSGNAAPDRSQGGLSFSINNNGRSVLGESAGESLQGKLWEAGEEPDNLIFGVSIASKEHVWLNALHVVYPDKLSHSELGKSLVIDTYPMRDNAAASGGKDQKPESK